MPVMRGCLFGEDTTEGSEETVDLITIERANGTEKAVFLKGADLVCGELH